MSLINQVLKDIEQRQASLQLEESQLKAKLRPVLMSTAREWHLLAWFKLLLLVIIVGSLLYFVWIKVLADIHSKASNVSIDHQTLTPTVNLDWQMHPQLTKKLSSDWQDRVVASDTSLRNVAKHSEKMASKPSEQLPKPVLNQAEQLRLGNVSNADIDASEKTTSAISVIDSNKSLAAARTAMPRQDVNVMAIKPADPNFTSAITPVVGVETMAVFKQMKPEQEANQYLQRAMDMHQKGRMPEAIDATKTALSLSPQSEEARQLLASYLVESKQSQEAVQVLQSGLQLQPKQLGLRKALAKLQLAEGQQEKALETLQQGAEQAPRDADYSAFWALTLQKVNKHRAALPLFEQALRSSPNQVQWLVGYAVSLQAEGRGQDALKQFQEAQNLPSSERLSAFIQQRIQQLQNP